jgi:hypothetical protein
MTGRNWIGLSLVAVAAALAGCAGDTPLGPHGHAAAAAPLADARLAGAEKSKAHKAPDLEGCEILEVQGKSKVVAHAFATGVQIYRWSGSAWSFIAPEATLFADAMGRRQVGTHYAGPTWESSRGSKVVGAVQQRCTPNPASIPWLLLGAVSNEGHGVFSNVSFIQRLNTAGGLAPAAAGTVVGEESRVPYTAEYYFYRTK